MVGYSLRNLDLKLGVLGQEIFVDVLKTCFILFFPYSYLGLADPVSQVILVEIWNLARFIMVPPWYDFPLNKKALFACTK